MLLFFQAADKIVCRQTRLFGIFSELINCLFFHLVIAITNKSLLLQSESFFFYLTAAHLQRLVRATVFFLSGFKKA